MGKGGRQKNRRKPTKPLPKVGTPANDKYRLEHSRKDVKNFGLRSSSGKVSNIALFGLLMIIALLIIGIFFVTL